MPLVIEGISLLGSVMISPCKGILLKMNSRDIYKQY